MAQSNRRKPQNAMRDSIVTNDLIKQNYNRKSAQLAMVMSMLVPGAGQFYANKTVLTTYYFPGFGNRADWRTGVFQQRRQR